LDVLGVGIDIIRVSRIERLLKEKGKRFKERIFTEAECNYCERFKHRAEHYAVRFAAKEAVRKAISPIFKGYYNYKDIEVVRQEDGMPGIRLHGTLSKIETQGVMFNVSLTHEHDYAVAIVLLQKNGS
jgi:holo-[acyl-carrier protein] synthase